MIEHAGDYIMNDAMIQLANTVWWDRSQEDKVYVEQIRIVIREFPFATRQVFLRFGENGPDLDLSYFDMDRIAVEYLLKRGVELPPEVQNFKKSVPPPQCDFLVPEK